MSHVTCLHRRVPRPRWSRRPTDRPTSAGRSRCPPSSVSPARADSKTWPSSLVSSSRPDTASATSSAGSPRADAHRAPGRPARRPRRSAAADGDPEPKPRPPGTWISAAAGIAGTAGLGSLFHGLAVGRMTVVAPLAAVVASTIPVVWALSTGEDPTALALVGVVVAIGAGALAADHDVDETRARAGTSRLGSRWPLPDPASGPRSSSSPRPARTPAWPAVIARRRRSLRDRRGAGHRAPPAACGGRARRGRLRRARRRGQLVPAGGRTPGAREPCGARRRVGSVLTVLLARQALGERSTRLRRPACSPPSRGWC